MVGFSLLIISIVFMQEKGFPGWQATIPIAGTVLIIMAGKDAILNRWILSNKVLVWFGLISYPMYLWHWPLISMRRIVTLEPPSTIYCAGAFVACTILAWLTTKLIENPLRFGQHGKIKTIGLFITMVILGITGYVIYKKGGISSRFPEHTYFQEIIKKKSLNNSGFTKGKGNNPCRAPLGKMWNFKECRELPENVIDSNKKTIVIWGDSHAASLIPGFKKYYGDKYNIVQRTIDGCSSESLPEKGKFAKGSCMKNNERIFEEISKMQPYQVVLAGRWVKRDYKKLGKTVNRLKIQDIKNISLIGPIPEWRNPLPKELIKKHSEYGKYPLKLKNYDDKFMKVNQWMSAYSIDWGINYLSLSDLLCDSEGCITMTSNNPENVLMYDESHLTEHGSEYIVNILKEKGAVLDN